MGHRNDQKQTSSKSLKDVEFKILSNSSFVALSMSACGVQNTNCSSCLLHQCMACNSDFRFFVYSMNISTNSPIASSSIVGPPSSSQFYLFVDLLFLDVVSLFVSLPQHSQCEMLDPTFLGKGEKSKKKGEGMGWPSMRRGGASAGLVVGCRGVQTPQQHLKWLHHNQGKGAAKYLCSCYRLQWASSDTTI